MLRRPPETIENGVSYSPPDAEWPGWLFYASTHFGPAGARWRDLPALNLYAARCQAVLQSGTADSDVLLYYPIYDLWQRPKGLTKNFGDLVQPTQVHYIAQWLLDTPFHKLATEMTSSGRVFKTANVTALLDQLRIRREPLVATGLQFIRRRHDAGYHYFLTSLGNHRVNGWVDLGVAARSAVAMDPMTGKTGRAPIEKGAGGNARVFLQIEPGQSLILRTFDVKEVEGPRWRSFQLVGGPTEIVGDWQVKFVAGGPKLPPDHTTNRLVSWTEFPSEETARFGGTARYTLRFSLPETKADEWRLDLGRVCECARVRVNGRAAGTLFSVPFQTLIGEFLQPGENLLEIEVTNLDANRIRDLERRKVTWKRFYDINYVSILYRRFDAADWPLTASGLLGPVRLTPLMVIAPSNLN